MDKWDYALREIEKTYGVHCSYDKKAKQLIKFGKNTALTTAWQTVWNVGGNETLPTSNVQAYISSSNDDDNQICIVEGHKFDEDGNKVFVTTTVTMDGQVKTPLPATEMCRWTRLINNDSTDFQGTVYVYEDDTVTDGVPQTPAKIHLKTDGSNNQSLKCASALSNVDFFVISALTGGVNRQNSRSVDFAFQVALAGKVFRTIFPFSAHSTSGTRDIDLPVCLIVPRNADFRMRAISSGADTQVEASAIGRLAIIEEGQGVEV